MSISWIEPLRMQRGDPFFPLSFSAFPAFSAVQLTLDIISRGQYRFFLKTIMKMIFINSSCPVLILLLLAAMPLEARMITREEALAAVFPGAAIKQSMIFLTEEEQKESARLAGVPITSALIAQYSASRDGKAVGAAYLDTHVVRTKKESLLMIVNAEGKLVRVEVVAFLEPPEYMPPDIWYRQFDNRVLNDELNLKRSIHPVTGATLTARATTEAVRKALAVDQVLRNRKHP